MSKNSFFIPKSFKVSRFIEGVEAVDAIQNEIQDLFVFVDPQDLYQEFWYELFIRWICFD